MNALKIIIFLIEEESKITERNIYISFLLKHTTHCQIIHYLFCSYFKVSLMFSDSLRFFFSFFLVLLLRFQNANINRNKAKTWIKKEQGYKEKVLYTSIDILYVWQYVSGARTSVTVDMATGASQQTGSSTPQQPSRHLDTIGNGERQKTIERTREQEQESAGFAKRTREREHRSKERIIKAGRGRWQIYIQKFCAQNHTVINEKEKEKKRSSSCLNSSFLFLIITNTFSFFSVSMFLLCDFKMKNIYY